VTKVAYILAASHSGSTLLSLLLGVHPKIASIGEMKLSAAAIGDIVLYRCSCGRPIRECWFWQKLKEGMAAQGCEFDLAEPRIDFRTVESRYARWLLRPMYRGALLEAVRDIALSCSGTWRKQLSEIHQRNAALASTICEIASAEIVVDSSKNALRLKYLLRNPGLNIKVIHLIRDGRGVVLTYMDPGGFADAKDPALRGGGTGGKGGNRKLTMAQAAYEWRRCMEEAANILRRLSPTQWIEVRYEDYCEDPDATLNRLQRFLGVESGIASTGFRSVQQHVVGNGMRLDTTAEIRLDERWRQELTPQDLAVFDRIAGDINRHYGYR
jgi:hypothetical protein